MGFLSDESAVSSSGPGVAKSSGENESVGSGVENSADGSIVAGVDDSFPNRLGNESDTDSCLTRGDGVGVDSIVWLWRSVWVVESTGTAQTEGSGLAGCSRSSEAAVLRVIRGTRIVRYSAVGDVFVDAGGECYVPR